MSAIHLDKQQFSMKEVLRAVNAHFAGSAGGVKLTAMTVNNWLNRGHLSISEQNASIGRGKRREYSARDAVNIGAMHKLVAFGLSSVRGSDVLRYIDDRIDFLRLDTKAANRGAMSVAMLLTVDHGVFHHVFYERNDRGERVDLAEELKGYPAAVVVDADQIIRLVLMELESIVKEQELGESQALSSLEEIAETEAVLRLWKVTFADLHMERDEITHQLIARHGSLEVAERSNDTQMRDYARVAARLTQAEENIRLVDQSLQAKRRT